MKMHVELERDGDSEMFEDLERYLRYHPTLTRFLFNPAGFTFLIGWILYMGMFIGWVGLLVVDPRIAGNAITVVIAEFTGGREVAIPLGILQLGLPPLLVAGISFTQDLVSTAWVYPIFYLYRRRHEGRDTFAGYFFAKMERKAVQHREAVQRYGAVGLYFFMLIPFAVNGPLIGAIIGKLAGIRTRYILPTVVLATFTATSIWTLLWYYAAPDVQAFVDRFGGHWIALAMILLFVAVLGSTFINFMRDLRRYRRLDSERRERAGRTQVVQSLHATEQAETGASEPPRPPV